MRIQILPLPYQPFTTTQPFVIVIDRMSDEAAKSLSNPDTIESLRQNWGAKATLFLHGTEDCEISPGSTSPTSSASSCSPTSTW